MEYPCKKCCKIFCIFNHLRKFCIFFLKKRKHLFTPLLLLLHQLWSNPRHCHYYLPPLRGGYRANARGFQGFLQGSRKKRYFLNGKPLRPYPPPHELNGSRNLRDNLGLWPNPRHCHYYLPLHRGFQEPSNPEGFRNPLTQRVSGTLLPRWFQEPSNPEGFRNSLTRRVSGTL